MVAFLHLSSGYAWLLALGLAFASPLCANAAEPLDFGKDIRPILSNRCFACHGPDAAHREAELRLDVEAEALATRDSGQAIVPGQPEQSLIWQRIVSTDPDEVMPPPGDHKPMTPEEREKIKAWIAAGAPYEQHWSFVAPKPVSIPASSHPNPIDAFLEVARKSKGLEAAPKADRRTLIRRITLDLTGLPPTPQEVDEFLADQSDNAVEELVGRLLKRETYGEHMARYWLDLSRYADTHGLHLDNERSMWPYRDWVVQAYNQNLPFDQFTRWQLAGDLLPNPTLEQQIASGFNRCNVTTSEGGSIKEEFIYRYAVDRTTTMAEVWMGLTAGCATCHDHKFDPISTHEYYSMYAFFHSAADPAMDGNKKDTPPILTILSDEEKEQLAKLDTELKETQEAFQKLVQEFSYVDPAKQDPSLHKTTEAEIVWFEDGFPSGANPQASGDPLNLITAEDGPVFSGELAISRTSKGVAQDFYSGGADFVLPKDATNTTIFAYAYLDPENTPETIMLQFHTGGWNHRAVWGAADKIPFGEPDTTQKRSKGDLPATGEWVRLEVSLEEVGLKPGDKIQGYAFTQFGGTVYWDRLGVETLIDPVKDPRYSFSAWQTANQGKKPTGFPNNLANIIEKKKIEEWNPKQTEQIFKHWLEQEFAGLGEEATKLKSRQARLKVEKEKIEQAAAVTLVMADLPNMRESFVMQRGAYDAPGDPVTRNVPAFLPQLPTLKEGEVYDRLDLANWLVSGNHPLTARVTVNRIWQQFFGIGIVKSSADFGSQGEPPVHPELLDFLANDFVQHGWDVQRLVKMIVLSEAYQQDSAVSTELWNADPENRYLARGPRLRLDAEVLRDQALFVSGLLVQKLGGPGVKPYQPPNIWEPVAFGGSNTRFYKQDSGESLYRRSLYTFLKRTAPPPFLSTFDAPNREQSCSRRERTNTPLQALQLMNDIQYVEAARNLAQRMILEGGKTPEARLDWAWLTVLSRPLLPTERQTLLTTLDEFQQRYQEDSAAASELVGYGESPVPENLAPSELAAYTMVANLILNLDETLNKN